SVGFYNGATLLGTANVVNGVAALSVSTLPLGASTLLAQYSGDTNTLAGTSAVLTETVTANPTATTAALTASPNSAARGATVTLRAQVTGSSPSGLVTFFKGTVAL